MSAEVRSPLHLSIAMAAYNGSPFLSQQLDSIASQTRAPDELVVCNDCSTDDSAEVLAAFAADCPFPVHLHNNSRRLGYTRSAEAAIQMCSGDIVVLCDADDVWLPSKLELIEAAFAVDAEVGLVASDSHVVDEQLCPLGFTLWERHGFRVRKRHRVERGDFRLLTGAPLWGHQLAFRSKFKTLVVPLPQVTPDTWIKLVVGAVSRVRLLSAPLVKYRRHSEQFTDGVLERSLFRRLTYATGPNAASNTRLLADVIEELTARLSSANMLGFTCRPSVMRAVDEWRRHRQTRRDLPANFVRRAASVLNELVRLHYHRYASGWLSVAKDLAVGGSPRSSG